MTLVKMMVKPVSNFLTCSEITLPDDKTVLLGCISLSYIEKIRLEKIEYIFNCAWDSKEFYNSKYDIRQAFEEGILIEHNLIKWLDHEDILLYDIHDEQQVHDTDYIDSMLKKCYDAIQNGNRVAVHCNAGISRSVSLLMMVLIRYYDMTASQALELIKKQRSEADPNDGFMEQLEEFYEINNPSTNVEENQ